MGAYSLRVCGLGVYNLRVHKLELPILDLFTHTHIELGIYSLGNTLEVYNLGIYELELPIFNLVTHAHTPMLEKDYTTFQRKRCSRNDYILAQTAQQHRSTSAQ